MVPTTLITGALAFVLPSAPVHPSMMTMHSSSHVRMSLDASVGNAMVQSLPPQAMLLAEGDSGINPVFLLLGALPLVAGAAFVFVSGEEKKVAERRADPANAGRLGYTVEEVEKMEEMTRLRYEGDLKEFNAAVAEAEANGSEKPNGLTWLAEKASKRSGYFDGGNNERPTMI
jgi:hypothetical protein